MNWWWFLLAAAAVVVLLRAWPQKPVERCAVCSHRRGSHWDDCYCLRTDCACTRYEAEE